MIRIEGIPMVAARLAAAQKAVFAQGSGKIRRIAKVAARGKSLSVIRAARKIRTQFA